MRIIARPVPGLTLPAAVAGGAITTMQIFPRTDDATKPLILQIPGALKENLPGRILTVRASGRITTGAATNVTATLQSGSSLTSGSNATVLASTARACNTASCPWFMEFRLIFDHTSGLLHGVGLFVVNNLFDAAAAITAVASLTDNTTDPLVNLVAGITFSSGNAGNKAWLDEFVLGM